MQKVGVYQKNAKLYIHPYSKTIMGVWIVTKPIFILDILDYSELGEIITSAFAESKEAIPHPTNWKEINNLVPATAGNKNSSSFYKKAKLVNIELKNNCLIFTPTRNLGTVAGFEDIDSKSRAINDLNNTVEIGKILQVVMEDSEII